MALYSYNKYTIREYYTYSWGAASEYTRTGRQPGYPSFSFNSNTGKFSNVGEIGDVGRDMSVGYRAAYDGSSCDKYSNAKLGSFDRFYYQKSEATPQRDRDRGSLVQLNIIAENGTYPANGISGSYWYVRGSIITPTVPGSISLAGEFKGGKEVTIDWGTSNYVTNYRLERQLDGGAWTQIYSGADASYTDIIPRGTNIVAYRARVYGNTQYSRYVTSPTRTVKNFPEMGLKVNNQLKMGEQGWVKVNGELRNIDTIWVRVNGVLKES